MGTRDSTKTRVVPIFDELATRDRSGASWLGHLLQLPLDGRPVDRSLNFGVIERVGLWGESEQRLQAPVALLEWLVTHPASLAVEALDGPMSHSVREKRRALLAGDLPTREEALMGLRRGAFGRGWFVLEGETRPDVYIATEKAIVLIEGKRTENAPTTRTTWMPVRHQLLRHIDAAWDGRGSRSVYGFFIVEGEGGAEAIRVPPKWVDSCSTTIAPGVLRASLPHRSEEQRAQIAHAYLGVTTWQRICRDFRIEWSSLPDEIAVTAE